MVKKRRIGVKESLFNTITASIGIFFSFLFGQVDGLLTALIVFVILDYVSGLLVAVENKTFSSEVGFKGILKKALLFVIVIVGNIVDTQVIGSGTAFRSAVLFMLIANEGISILENCGNAGLPIPKKLMEMLKQLKDKEDIT